MKNFKKVMLAILSVVKPEEAIDRAFNLAKEKDSKLYIALFIKKEIPEPLKKQMMYNGYLGEKIQEDVKETIKDKYSNRMDEIQKTIEKRAKKEDVEIDIEIINKASLMKGHDLVDKKNIDYIVINYQDDEYISQVFSKYFKQEFIEDLGIPYELYLDGKRNEIKRRT
ncbi:MAG: universal stress protein [Bacillota bacterium]